jgi:hypothetical protein
MERHAFDDAGQDCDRTETATRLGSIRYDLALDASGGWLMPYKVRLTGPRQRVYAHQLIDAAPDYSIVSIVGGDRTIDQNYKMWAMLTDVAMSRPEGRKWPTETWKCAFMHSLGHQVQFADGLDGSGPFPLGFKTSKLNKKQMSDLIEVIYEYGSRHNVEWSE